MNYNSESVNKIDIFFKTYKFIEKIKSQFPDANWNDCLSKGQIKSKLWVVDELKKVDEYMGVTFIYGGWYGTLARILFDCDLKLKVIRSFDIDESCQFIAETLNRSYVMDKWKFKATTVDIMDINKFPFIYRTPRRNGTICELNETPDCIINTSCEHMDSSWFKNIPKHTLIVLQSNNYDEIKEHINCDENIDEMKKKYPLTHIRYEGTLQLINYNRYMLIGRK